MTVSAPWESPSMLVISDCHAPRGEPSVWSGLVPPQARENTTSMTSIEKMFRAALAATELASSTRGKHEAQSQPCGYKPTEKPSLNPAPRSHKKYLGRYQTVT